LKLLVVNSHDDALYLFIRHIQPPLDQIHCAIQDLPKAYVSGVKRSEA